MSSRNSLKSPRNAKAAVNTRPVLRATFRPEEHAPTSADLLRLPTEVLHHVLSYLEALDIIRCTEVCKRIRDVIRRSSSLQYIIESFFDHLIPNTGVRATHATLFGRLLRTRRAWDTLTPTFTERIALDGVAVYEVREGVWVSGKPPPTDREVIKSISKFELPVAAHLENRMQETQMELDAEVMDFSICPSDDLLVVLEDPASNGELQIRLKSLSDNRPHPGAAKHTLEIPYREDLLIMSLFRDHVVITNFPEEAFGILPGAVVWWNWRTGNILRDYPHGASSIVLSDTHLAVLVYENTEFSFHIISSFQDPKDTNPLCKLLLPKCTSAALCPYAFTSDPTYSSIQTHSQMSRDRPTRADETADLICVQACRQIQPDYLIFFRRSTLLSTFETLTQTHPEEKEFEWDTWGPDISRWIEVPDSHTYEGCIHGLKFVTMVKRGYAQQKWRNMLTSHSMRQTGYPIPTHKSSHKIMGSVTNGSLPSPWLHDTENPSWRGKEETSSDEDGDEGEETKVYDDDDLHLFMLDFNPRPITRGAKTYSDRTVDQFVVKAETAVKGWAEHDIVSRMPFRAIISRRVVGVNVDDLVVDGDNVVGVEMVAEDDGQGDIETGLLERIRIMTF